MSDSKSSTAFVVEAWYPVLRNTLRGFVTVRQPSGMIIADIALHQRDGRAWALPPSKPMVDHEGRQIRDAGGKARWMPLITFSDRRTQSVWSDAVIAAIRAAHPNALP